MNKYNDLRQNLIIFDFALKMQKRTFERIADGNLDSYGRWMKTNFGINKKDHGDIVFDAKKMRASLFAIAHGNAGQAAAILEHFYENESQFNLK